MDPGIQRRLQVAGALSVALASAIWFGLVRRPDRLIERDAPRSRPEVLTMALEGAIETPVNPGRSWEPPLPQSHGSGWVFELFTPPEIHYDDVTKSFVVRDHRPGRAPSTPPPSGAAVTLTLLEVRRPLTRLQLVGYAGDERGHHGIFEDTVTAETFLAGRGQRLSKLGMTIDAFAVERRPLVLSEGGAMLRRVASARVRDDATGETFGLTDHERRYATRPMALILAGAEGTPRDVGEGDQFVLDGVCFRVGRIGLDPPSMDVLIEREGASEIERQTLTPEMPGGSVTTAR